LRQLIANGRGGDDDRRAATIRHATTTMRDTAETPP
jgi:hypothetical protein